MQQFISRILKTPATSPAIAAFNLNSGEHVENGVEFPLELFSSVHNIEEFDTEDLTINDEGNADGELYIFFNSGESLALAFENFSPLICEFNSYTDQARQEILDSLLEDINANIDFGN